MKLWVFALLVGSAFAIPAFEPRFKRNVGTLLDQLVEELGVNDLLPWFQEMIKNDPDVQRVVEFFKSDKWNKIKDHLRNCPTYKNVKGKLEKEGIFLEQILDDIKEFVVGSQFRIQARRPLGDILQDFIGKLDLERIVTIVQDKINNDSDMQKLVAFMKGDELKEIVDCMKESEDVKDLLEQLKDENIDVKKLIEMVEALFGVTRYYRQAKNIGSFLDKLIKEIGLHDLLPWLQEKIKNDPDVQRIVEYFRGESWNTLKKQLKDCPGYDSVKDKLLAEGIDIIQILEDIKTFVTGGTRTPRKSLGELLNEVLGQLDLDRVIVTIQDKLDNDPDMQKIIQFIKGEEIKVIADCMRQSSEVQNLIAKLKAEGIDVLRMVQLLKIIFSTEFFYKIH